MRSILLPATLSAFLLPASAAPPPVRLELLVEQQLQSPTTITHAGDGSGRLFITEQRGTIRVVKDGILLPQVFLDLSALLVPERPNFDERGLLGLAFHPDFENAAQPGHRRFYVFYSAPSPNAPGTAADPVDCRSIIAEYLVSATDPAVADPASARVLLVLDKPQFNHNGGQLAFGPDGFLYIGTGDGGSSNDNNAGHTGGSAARPTGALGNAQDLTRLLGKILRIDPLGTNGPGGAYGIPAGNPYATSPGGERPEIYAFGLRNPWRFSFDRQDGRLFAADVGQGSVEEVNIVTAGGNYGWRNFEGSFTPSFSAGAPVPAVTPTPPIAQYAHPGVTIGSPALPQIGVSITGGFVYRGAAIPGLQGVYVFADWSQNGQNPLGVLMGLEEGTPSWSLSTLNVEGGNPVPWFIQALGEDESGELYVAGKLTRGVSELSSGQPAGALLKLMHAPQTVRLGPVQDTTIYSESSNAFGAGVSLFAGNNSSGNHRRGLMRFDLSVIPAGVDVQSASLRMVLTQSQPGTHEVRLHRLLSAWGEGTSTSPGAGGSGGTPTAGSATWAHRSFTNALWQVEGGEFEVAASVTNLVSATPGPFVWTGPGVVEDVAFWHASGFANAGWILIGEEGVDSSAKRFASRESSTAADRPELSVTYQVVPPPLSRRQQWERAHFLRGQFVDDLADLEADRAPNLLEYAFDQDPEAANVAGETLWVTGDVAHFLRDPRATDLTYNLETGSAPDGLTTVIATSTGGAPATGATVLAETPSGSRPGLIEVTVRIPGPDAAFVRVSVQRN